MVVTLVALGALLAGSGVTAMVARYFFLLGWEKGRDDRWLDPGETVGQLPAVAAEETTGPIAAVGESSGRHAMPELPGWPTAAERREIAEDSRFVDTQDADDYAAHERLMDGAEQ